MFYCPTPQNSQDFQSHIYQAQHIVIPCFHPFIGKLHRNNQAHQADIKKRADASQHQPSCLLMVVTSHATGKRSMASQFLYQSTSNTSQSFQLSV